MRIYTKTINFILSRICFASYDLRRDLFNRHDPILFAFNDSGINGETSN